MTNKILSVSVIIPVYNSAAYLDECIQSLLQQTYSPEEIILVDDGSEDGSGDICDNYASQYNYIRVIHKENGGVSSARNVGIAVSQGEYLVFIDSDDYIHPQMLEKYAAFFSDEKVLMCCFECISVLQMGQKYESLPNGVKGYSVSEFMDLFNDNYINVPWNKLYSSKLVKKHGIKFPEEMSLGEDLFFNLEYLKYAPEKYCIIKEPLYFYRDGLNGSLSNSFRKDLFELQMCMFEKLRNFLEYKKIMSGRNKGQYLRLFWNRLYLTLNAYRTEGKIESTLESRIQTDVILYHPIWETLWLECKEEKVIDLKMAIKKVIVNFMRLERKWKTK